MLAGILPGEISRAAPGRGEASLDSLYNAAAHSDCSKSSAHTQFDYFQLSYPRACFPALTRTSFAGGHPDRRDRA